MLPLSPCAGSRSATPPATDTTISAGSVSDQPYLALRAGLDAPGPTAALGDLDKGRDTSGDPVARPRPAGWSVPVIILPADADVDRGRPCGGTCRTTPLLRYRLSRRVLLDAAATLEYAVDGGREQADRHREARSTGSR